MLTFKPVALQKPSQATNELHNIKESNGTKKTPLKKANIKTSESPDGETDEKATQTITKKEKSKKKEKKVFINDEARIILPKKPKVNKSIATLKLKRKKAIESVNDLYSLKTRLNTLKMKVKENLETVLDEYIVELFDDYFIQNYKYNIEKFNTQFPKKVLATGQLKGILGKEPYPPVVGARKPQNQYRKKKPLRRNQDFTDNPLSRGSLLRKNRSIEF